MRDGQWSKVGLLRQKVGEKGRKSEQKGGGSLKMVADGEYTHVGVGKKGYRVGPSFRRPCMVLRRGGSQTSMPMLCIGRGHFVFESVVNLEWLGVSTGESRCLYLGTPPSV